MNSGLLRLVGKLGGLRVLILLAVLVGDVLLAAFLGAEKKGLWHLFLQSSLILATLSLLGQTIAYNWGVRSALDQAGRLLANMMIVVLIATIVCLSVVWVGLAPLGEHLGGVFLYLEPRLTVFISMVAAQILFYSATMVATTARLPVAWFGVRFAYRVGLVATIALTGLMLPTRSDTLFDALLWAFTLVTTLAALAGFWIAKMRPTWPSPAIESQARYGLKALPVEVGMRRGAQVELLVVASLSPLAAIGAYTVAASFSRLFTAVGDVFQNLLYSRDLKNNTKENTTAALRLQFLGCLLLWPVFAVTLSVFLIPLLYTEEFSLASHIVLLTLPAAMMASLCQGLLPFIMQSGRAGQIFWALLGMLLLRGGLTVSLHPILGIFSAPVAGLVGYSLFWLYLLRLTAHGLRLSILELLRPRQDDWTTALSLFQKAISKFRLSRKS